MKAKKNLAELILMIMLQFTFYETFLKVLKVILKNE